MFYPLKLVSMLLILLAGEEQNLSTLGTILVSTAAATNQNLAVHNLIQGVNILQQQDYSNLNPTIQNKLVKYNFTGPPQTLVRQYINP